MVHGNLEKIQVKIVLPNKHDNLPYLENQFLEKNRKSSSANGASTSKHSHFEVTKQVRYQLILIGVKSRIHASPLFFFHQWDITAVAGPKINPEDI